MAWSSRGTASPSSFPVGSTSDRPRSTGRRLGDKRVAGVTTQRGLSVVLAASAAALACCTTALRAEPVARRAIAATPVLLAAAPHGDPSDRSGGGFLRVTFSPDGDGRRDAVLIFVRARPGHELFLHVRPESLG